MREASGFILISVLLTLMVMMLLTLSQWQSLLLFQRMMGRVWEAEGVLQNMEDTAEQIWQDYTQNKKDDCVERVCQRQMQQALYHYQIEKLGIYPCMQQVQAGQPYSTEQFNLTLKRMQAPYVELQVRLARAVALRPCLSHEYRFVPRVLNWNYIQG